MILCSQKNKSHIAMKPLFYFFIKLAVLSYNALSSLTVIFL